MAGQQVQIDRYESTLYLGPQSVFAFRTLLVAYGTIDGTVYTYAEFVDEKECPPGTVPEHFKKMAQVAFDRAWHNVWMNPEG